MSYEKAKKYLPKSVSKEDFETGLKELEKVNIPFQAPTLSTAAGSYALVRPGIAISEMKRATEERRHKELLEAILEGKKKTKKTLKNIKDTGRPRLDEKEREYRLSAAKFAIEKRKSNPQKTWGEIIIEMDFMPGYPIATKRRALSKYISEYKKLSKDDTLYQELK